MITQELQNVKTQHFKQVTYELYRWWIEENPDKENDLNITKVMKLLFFVSGADSENHLFNVFNKFQAWQYGHVEADIYSFYSEKDGAFGNFTIDRNRLVFKDERPLESDSFSEKIKNNIQILKDKNPDLISYDTFRLVDINHTYYSWDIYYNKLNKRHEDIEIEMLIYEPKRYV